jgi:hypothetical protein
MKNSTTNTTKTLSSTLSLFLVMFLFCNCKISPLEPVETNPNEVEILDGIDGETQYVVLNYIFSEEANSDLKKYSDDEQTLTITAISNNKVIYTKEITKFNDYYFTHGARMLIRKVVIKGDIHITFNKTNDVNNDVDNWGGFTFVTDFDLGELVEDSDNGSFVDMNL